MIPKECRRLADLPAPRRGKFFVYVLKCSEASFYIGQSEDPFAASSSMRMGKYHGRLRADR